VVLKGPNLRPWPPFGLRFPGGFPTVLKKRFVRRYGHFSLFFFQKPRVPGLFSTSPGSPDRRRKELLSLCETGLKIPWWRHRAGSTPASGTKNKDRPRAVFVFDIDHCGGRTGGSSEWSPSGAPELPPERAAASVRPPLPAPKGPRQGSHYHNAYIYRIFCYYLI